jgi:tRNA(Ile)-lysidine synthase
LHLFVAQHRDDQAETFLLRLARGSGLDGAAAMAPLRCTQDLRILRPLLAVPKARLEASLAACGLGWVEDPTNQDRSFARVRLRQLLPELAREGLTAERLSKTARLLGRSRQALQVTLAGFLARHVRFDPAGFLLLDHGALLRAPEEVALRALANSLMSVGGRGFGPRLDRLEQLYGALQDTAFSGATLSKVKLSQKAGQLLFVREARGLESCRLRPGEAGRWDGRFDLRLGLQPGPGKGPNVVRALGREGRRELRRGGHRDQRSLPAAVQVTLPSLWDDLGLIFVPFLGYCRKGWGGATANMVIFRPDRPLLAAFTLV